MGCAVLVMDLNLDEPADTSWGENPVVHKAILKNFGRLRRSGAVVSRLASSHLNHR
jgi:hypothetical protein